MVTRPVKTLSEKVCCAAADWCTEKRPANSECEFWEGSLSGLVSDWIHFKASSHPRSLRLSFLILGVQGHCLSRIPDLQGGLEGVLRRGGRQIHRHRGTSPGEQCCCRFWNPGSPGWLPRRLESEQRWQHPPAEACKAGVSSGTSAYNGIATNLSLINLNFLKKYIFPLNKKYE